MEEIEIVRLSPDDWQQLKELRLRALKEEPAAFGASYQEALSRSEDLWRESLTNPWYFFAKQGPKLVGMVSAQREKHEKSKHVASIFGVYVTSEVRGNGVGKRCMQTLLDELEKDKTIIKVRLFVSATQVAAKRMYKSLGFEQNGLYEKELYVGGKYLDEIAMVKFLQKV